MFQLKTNSRITYTPMCVFGSNRKYGQMENQLHVDRKITYFSHKTNATFILPSNDFQDSQAKRERERESTSHNPKPRSGLTSAKLRPAQIVLAHSPDHVAPPPRSHAGQASSFFSLLPQRRRHLDRSLASRSCRHHLRPISFLTHPRPISSPPLKMVAVAKDQSLFPDLSLFPSISQSFSLWSLILSL